MEKKEKNPYIVDVKKITNRMKRKMERDWNECRGYVAHDPADLLKLD